MSIIYNFSIFTVTSALALIGSSDWGNENPNKPLNGVPFYGVVIDGTNPKTLGQVPTFITARSVTILFAKDSYDSSDDANAFIEIIWRESRFDPHATNSESGAYGLGQALPPEKMDSVGSDWRTNPLTQLQWVREYISERYGDPVVALAHHDKYGWY